MSRDHEQESTFTWETMQFTQLKPLLFAVLFLLAGCASGQQSATRSGPGFTEYGQASYYADKYQNRKTASGEIYQHKLKTAAHKKLPFGSKVKVTNLANQKSVVVIINDRGPFTGNRIIDISYAAADRIGMIRKGVVKVRLEILE